jgi:hypothetical protein
LSLIDQNSLNDVKKDQQIRKSLRKLFRARNKERREEIGKLWTIENNQSKQELDEEIALLYKKRREEVFAERVKKEREEVIAEKEKLIVDLRIAYRKKKEEERKQREEERKQREIEREIIDKEKRERELAEETFEIQVREALKKILEERMQKLEGRSEIEKNKETHIAEDPSIAMIYRQKLPLTTFPVFYPYIHDKQLYLSHGNFDKLPKFHPIRQILNEISKLLGQYSNRNDYDLSFEHVILNKLEVAKNFYDLEEVKKQLVKKLKF